MNLYFVISIFVFCIVLVEIGLRFYSGFRINRLREKDLIKFMLGRSKDNAKNYRFSVQASYMGLNIDHLHEIMAKANQTDSKTIARIYSGSKAVEKLSFRPFVGFSNRPGQTLSYTEINDLGFQATSTNFRKPPNRKRVLILGGSMAFGIGGTSKKNNLTYKLEQKLNSLEQESGNQCQWEVVNLSFVAAQSISELNQLVIYAAMFSPDIVVQLSGFNDLYFFLNEKKLFTYNFYKSVIDALSYSKIFQYLEKRLYLARVLFRINNRVKTEPEGYGERNQIYTVW